MFISPCILQISSQEKMWDWLQDTLIPGLYEDGKDVGFTNATPYIGDGDAVLVGMPRVRQLRVKKGDKKIDFNLNDHRSRMV